MSPTTRTCAGLFLLGCLLCVPGILFDRFPFPDVAERYVLMAEEFAAGHWDRAFHPRFPPLTPALGGLIASTGMPAFAAIKSASAFWFAFGAIAVFLLQRRVFGEPTALWAAMLYLLCSRLLRLGPSGLLDPGKTAFFALAAYGLVRFAQSKDRGSVLIVALGAAGVAIARPEAVLQSLMLLAVMAGLEASAAWRKTGKEGTGTLCPQHTSGASHKRYLSPFSTLSKTLATTGLFCVLLLPWLAYTTLQTGYPVTASRQIPVVKRLEAALGLDLQIRAPRLPEYAGPTFPLPVDTSIAEPPTESTTTAGPTRPSRMLANATPESIWTWMIVETGEGMYPPYTLFVVVAMIIRRRRGTWSGAETILLTLFIAHSLLVVLSLMAMGSIWVEERYVAAASPLLFGWAAWAIRGSIAQLSDRGQMAKWAVHALVVLVVAGLLFDGWRRLRPSLRPEKQAMQQAEIECGRWLKTHAAMESHAGRPRLPSDWYNYHAGGRPILICEEATVQFLSGGDAVNTDVLGRVDDFRSFVALCKALDVDYVVVSPRLVRRFPFLRSHERLSPYFRPAFVKWKDAVQYRYILARS